MAQAEKEVLTDSLSDAVNEGEGHGDGVLLLEREEVTVIVLVLHSDTLALVLPLLERLEL